MSKKLIQISSSIASAVGVIIAVILVTLKIRAGYATMRTDNALENLIVKLMDVPIFTIIRDGEKLVGSGNYFLIILFGIVFAIILTGITILLELLIYKIKDKKKEVNGGTERR